MAFTNINKPSDYFNTVLYTGNSTDDRTVTGVGFQPDWLWIKDRSNARVHYLADRVRGDTKYLQSQSTTAEITSSSAVKSIDSDGFTTGTSTTVNSNGETYVAWNWLAGGTGVSNTDGSITSTVSANTTAGFSIATYTGNGTSGANFGHGLGVKPSCVIVKSRSLGTQNWQFVSKALSATPFASGNYLKLNSTDGMGTNTAVWNAEPTSSLIYLTSSPDTNSSGATYVCYAFAEKKGFSKFGSYTGNGSANGPFVYTGFKPAFVMIKLYNTTVDHWYIQDSKRLGYNFQNPELRPNSTNAENLPGYADMLSNGFKLRDNGDGNNGSGYGYIYMAFAESPFTTSTGIPTTAR